MGTALLCIGAFLIVLGILVFIGNLIFVSRSEEAEGTLIGETNVGRVSYTRPIVEFKTRDGQTIEFRDNSNLHGLLVAISEFYKRGILKQEASQKVRVAYSASNPRSARIKDFEHLQYMPVSLFTIGVLLLIFGMLPAGLTNSILGFLQKLPF